MSAEKHQFRDQYGEQPVRYHPFLQEALERLLEQRRYHDAQAFVHTEACDINNYEDAAHLLSQALEAVRERERTTA